VSASAAEANGRPTLHVKIIERTVIVRFVDFKMLVGDLLVRAMGDELTRLVEEEGHTRLLLNLSGVQYLSGAALGQLASLQRKLDPKQGRIQLCGLDPWLRDVLRMTRLDRVFDVYNDEPEALVSGLSGNISTKPSA
jgi:anti-anti-sigma factor